MIPNTFTTNMSTESSTKEILEAFISQLEVQKKMTSMFAIRGLQEYMKQFIQFSVFQDSLREKMVELQSTLYPQTLGLQHSPCNIFVSEQQDLMRASLEKMIEESFQSKYQTNSESNTTQDNFKIISEAPNQTKEASSRNLENRIRDSIMKEFTKKFSGSKHISKSDMNRFGSPNNTKSIVNPWKCGHEVHFSKGYCRECFNRIQHKKAMSRNQNSDFVSIYQQLRDKVKSIVKKTDQSAPKLQRALSSGSQDDQKVSKTDVKIEFSE